MQQRINQIRSQTPKSKFAVMYDKNYVKVLDGATAQERKLARDRHRMLASLEAAASASRPAAAATETSAKHNERVWKNDEGKNEDSCGDLGTGTLMVKTTMRRCAIKRVSRQGKGQ